MADPVVIECAGTCSVTVVHELSLPPLQLTPEEGGMVAGAVLLVWAVGFAFRMFIRAMRVDQQEATDSD